jgi:hypothetical protein
MSIPTIGSAAYRAWVDAHAASRIAIVELQPAEKLTTWAATGGATPNIYETAFSLQAATSQITGGIYRRLDGVEENGVALTVRASLALVNSNAGSWRFENDKIYVRTTGSVNPTTVSSIVAVFTIFVATEALDIPGGELYEGRLAGELPSVEAMIDTMYGAKISTTGDVVLPNGDGLFDSLSKAWAWHGRYATIRLGGRELAIADFEPVARMVMDRVLPNDESCRIVLRDEQDTLDSYLPLRVFSREDNPAAGDDVIGTYVPMLYGDVRSISPPLVDNTPGATVYLIADPNVQTITSVRNVRVTDPNGSIGLSEGDDYTVNLTACTVTLTRVDLVDQTIVLDATGPAAIATIPDLMKELLTRLGAPAADIDAASFTAAAAIHTEPFGLWLREGKPAAEYMTLIEGSIIAALIRDRTGLWTLLLDEGDQDLSEAPEFFDEDFTSWSPVPSDDEQVSEVRVRFDHRPIDGAESETSDSDTDTRWTQKTSQSWGVSTILRDRADAQRLAQQYMLRLKDRPVHVSFQETGLTLMTSQPFTSIRVTRDRAPSVEGSFDRRVVMIERLGKLLSPPSVDATLIDRPNMARIYDRAKAWSSDSIGSWASTSAGDRALYAFWHDDSDVVTTGVVNHSVWI